MSDLSINIEIALSEEQINNLIELISLYIEVINPGESLEEIKVINSKDLTAEVQKITGRLYKAGAYPPKGVSLPNIRGSKLSNIILLTDKLFIDGEEARFELISTLLEELYHCCIYDQAWKLQGHVYPVGSDAYQSNLLVMCTNIHDEYAVARLKNTFLGKYPILNDNNGNPIEYFIEYGASIIDFLDQAEKKFLSLAVLPNSEKLGISYRLIFEPLARHAGFLAATPSSYKLKYPQNPDSILFYQQFVAQYWKQALILLDDSFLERFKKRKETIVELSKLIDECILTLTHQS